MGEGSIIKHLYKPKLLKYLSILTFKLKTELHLSNLLSNLFVSFKILCEKLFFHNTNENLDL